MLNGHSRALATFPTSTPILIRTETARSSSRSLPLTKKNGRYRVLLLAGGPRDLATSIRAKLATRGLYVKYHWESDKENQWHRSIPKDVDFVISLKDFMGHSQEYALVTQCKRLNLRWVRSGRKDVHMMNNLYAHGVKKEFPLPDQYVATMEWETDLGREPAPKEPEPEKYVLSAPAERLPRSTADLHKMLAKELPDAPDEVTEPAALAEPAPTIPQATVDLVVKQAMSPIALPTPRPGVASSQIAALAAVLFQMCANEQVQVLCSPTEMTISSAVKSAA